VCKRVFLFTCVLIVCSAITDSFVRSKLGNRRPEPDSNLCHYGFDTLAIRRSTHGMIRRFVAVHAVKSKWRFGSKAASFHVSVYSYVFSYVLLPVGVSVSTRVISCYYLIYLTMYDYPYHFI